MREPTPISWKLTAELLLPIVAYDIIVSSLSRLREAWAWYVIGGLMAYLLLRLVVELSRAESRPKSKRPSE